MKPELLAICPDRIKILPVDPERGYPVPWFVSWIDGKPEFRAVDPAKIAEAVRCKLCWVCGQKLGSYLSFVIGPMCSINRISSEPPTHRECAEFSVKGCPFLSKPKMVRRDNDLPELVRENPGMLRHNPGASIVWTTKSYRIVPNGPSVLFRIGDPESVTWWTEGRQATREECKSAITKGLPKLQELCSGDDDLSHLEKLRQAAMVHLPAVIA